MRDAARAPGASSPVRLGLRENATQFALLVLVNGFVGAALGTERSVLPLLARDAFGIVSSMATLGFLVTFGLAKATSNYMAGRLVERLGSAACAACGLDLRDPGALSPLLEAIVVLGGRDERARRSPFAGSPLPPAQSFHYIPLE